MRDGGRCWRTARTKSPTMVPSGRVKVTLPRSIGPSWRCRVAVTCAAAGAGRDERERARHGRAVRSEWRRSSAVRSASARRRSAAGWRPGWWSGRCRRWRGRSSTLTVSSGSIAPLAGLQLSPVTFVAVLTTAGVPGTPQQAKTRREISSWAQKTVPTSRPALSATRSFQLPAVGLPSKPDSAWSGWKEPVNGAAPALIATVASSSNTVGVPAQSLAPVPKLSPPPPRRLERRPGAVRPIRLMHQVAVEGVVEAHADVDVGHRADVRHVDRHVDRGSGRASAALMSPLLAVRSG